MGQGCHRFGCFTLLFRLCGAIFESVAVVVGLDDVAVMGESIQQGSRHFCVPKYVCPFSEAEIGGDDEACVLVELADEVGTVVHHRPG